MFSTILTTKLYIPPPSPNNVPRPRLLERLNEGMSRKLTLVSAPAGFGKTTLVSQWLHQLKDEDREGKDEKENVHPSSPMLHPFKVAWLTLDEGDNDSTRFWTYFIAAFQQSNPEIGQTGLSLLQFPQLPSLESLLTTLINDLAATTPQFIMILDDYHLIEAQAIHKAIAFLLDHLPPQLHLVMTTRANPPLPLARLRSQGQLAELRARDLRFTPEEAATFLHRVTGLILSPENLASLAARTEGWVAGLQLAALSLQEVSDISGFIATFAGDDRYIADYLVEEVLARRSEEARNFLLQTSILDWMTGPLCDVVTGGVESQRLLEAFEQANLFLIPLDNKREWYRYHPLFADVLRHRLAQAHSQLLPELHRRASGWFEQNGLIAEAIRHRLSAKDFEQAAELIEQHGQGLIMQGQKETVQRWLVALPPDLVHARARFSLFQAWMGLLTLPMPEIEPFLLQAESILSSETSQAQAERQSWLGEIAAIRAIVAGIYGQLDRSLQLSQLALAQLPEGNSFARSAIAYNLGMTYRARGDIILAGQAFNQAIITGQAGDNLVIALIASYELAKIQIEQARLGQAFKTLQQAESFARNHAGPGKPILDSVDVGMGMLYYEWNDLKTALRRLTEGVELAQQRENVDVILDGQMTIARCYQAQGDTNKAQAVLQRAAEVAQDSPRPNAVPLVAAFQARLWLAVGQQAEVGLWLKNSGLSSNDELAYSREVEYITLARILVTQGKLETATSFLARLQQAAEAGRRTGRVIEILILQALALDHLSRRDQALAALGQALTLAEPEGYIRIFVDEGMPIAELLHEARSFGLASAYVDKLLAMFPDSQSTVQPEIEAKRSLEKNLIEPLSERELEVLRLVAAYASNKEIADRLIITEGTVKNHMSNILGKLGVRNRMQAIDKVKELGLI